MSAQTTLWWPTPEDIAEATRRALELVERAKAQHSPKVTICLFSGGNDSTSLLHLVRGVVDYVAHIDTGTGIPRTRQFVVETAQAFGVPLLIGDSGSQAWYAAQSEVGSDD